MTDITKKLKNIYSSIKYCDVLFEKNERDDMIVEFSSIEKYDFKYLFKRY